MRWFIICTIWLREMPDQLRDRRTLLMILGLSIVLYPLLGLGLLCFAVGFTQKPSVMVWWRLQQDTFCPTQGEPSRSGLRGCRRSEEIVMGSFLTIWIFISVTGILNMVSMGITTSQFAAYMPHGGISIRAIFWCVLLSLPQSAFFSALSLEIGAYARSSKERQYYLMPLIFLTLTPGVQLNPLYSMVPVTGVALLM